MSLGDDMVGIERGEENLVAKGEWEEDQQLLLQTFKPLRFANVSGPVRTGVPLLGSRVSKSGTCAQCPGIRVHRPTRLHTLRPNGRRLKASDISRRTSTNQLVCDHQGGPVTVNFPLPAGLVRSERFGWRQKWAGGE